MQYKHSLPANKHRPKDMPMPMQFLSSGARTYIHISNSSIFHSRFLGIYYFELLATLLSSFKPKYKTTT